MTMFGTPEKAQEYFDEEAIELPAFNINNAKVGDSIKVTAECGTTLYCVVKLIEKVKSNEES